MIVFINESEVASLLPMESAVDLVERALTQLGNDEAVNRPRQRIKLKGRMFHVMPAGSDRLGYAGLKAYSAGPSGTRFYFFLFDAGSGELLALFEADRLGQIRTGAATGVATRALSRRPVNGVGMIGTGWQARTQIEAIASVVSLERVLVFGRDEARRESFCGEMTEVLNSPVTPVSTPEAVTEMDILVTATSSRTPVLFGEWLRPGQLIHAVGSNYSHRRELDDEAVRRAGLVVVDALDQAQVECGELIQYFAERERVAGESEKSDSASVESWDDVAELGSILAKRSTGEDSEKAHEDTEAIQIFLSQGLAIEDVAVAAHVYERALEQGLGRRML